MAIQGMLKYVSFPFSAMGVAHGFPASPHFLRPNQDTLALVCDHAYEETG